MTNVPVDHRHEPTMLGAPFQSAPGVLVLNASRLRRFRECKQRYHLEFLLGLRPDTDLEPDADLASGFGLQVHDELRRRHADLTVHDEQTIIEPGPYDQKVMSAIRRHNEICPSTNGLTYLDGERDLKWLFSLKLVLVTGRVDALWSHPDGTIEIHDYKTGPVNHHIDNDEGTLIYALLAAAQYPGRRLRVIYEFLGGEQPVEVSVTITDEHLRRALDVITTTAAAIRTERSFAPNPHPVHCRSCPYQRSCPDAATVQPVRR
jgi:CRISPR/Cas system-associated exonuclease Cas4 (RecB family)